MDKNGMVHFIKYTPSKEMTLADVATQFYGSEGGFLWRTLLEYNDSITDINNVKGVELVVPFKSEKQCQLH